MPPNQGVCQEGEYNTRVLKNECMWESLREVLQTVVLVKRTWSKSCIFSMLYYISAEKLGLPQTNGEDACW